ncbi:MULTISPECIES: 1,6-anhydro-N-acetylmuramyl-L-alanine amidase AmpD [unclassified Brenneria]|uniref:1,6-anhydro-N-acetylmuramyl-L-alanine amidase AmpD n=1 Tax=unclassified Brenneria TaxID=2634434 RepID=UPI0029C51523|nr:MULTISPECIES: 1,6-anhydro-N-acetylmuramyl-L-alanine amidase AmpD [unclassified Brenneria]MDX5628906.1 1,6-anhydro-N-acetylmuramyl-L-alanine amidase AmpD [Brenneria sp. L3-3Z]MDX5696045.1 1,6-anhydro-N-acetylmuramyl-L-alanine amidase AmpD [Brenneria sp. L4-2C]
MLLENGWLSEIKHIPSPHCDRRPDDESPSLLVIHNISLPPGEFGGPYIDQLFTATLDPTAHPYFADICHLRVSAHCLIRRDGEIIQYVPFHQRAWHAGVSAFAGRERCNDFSIGIELEGTDTLPFTTEQYSQLVAITGMLMNAYPITPARITGHSDIAPGRKTDPGPAFDWDCYHRLLQENGIENEGSIKR